MPQRGVLAGECSGRAYRWEEGVWGKAFGPERTIVQSAASCAGGRTTSVNVATTDKGPPSRVGAATSARIGRMGPVPMVFG